MLHARWGIVFRSLCLLKEVMVYVTVGSCSLSIDCSGLSMSAWTHLVRLAHVGAENIDMQQRIEK